METGRLQWSTKRKEEFMGTPLRVSNADAREHSFGLRSQPDERAESGVASLALTSLCRQPTNTSSPCACLQLR